MHMHAWTIVLFLILTRTGKESMVEALDLLTHNAKNLRHAVEEVLYSAERAIIKLPPSDIERLGLHKKLDQGRVIVA